MKLLSSSLSLLLIALITVSPIGAQLPPTGSTFDLQLRLVESEPAVPVSSHSAKGFAVEVTDATGIPVSGAAVAFRLPESGPTGTFADGSHAAVVYSDDAGRAGVAGIQWGSSAGIAELRITAAKGSTHAGLLVQQTLTSLSAPPAQPGTLKTSAPSPVIVVTASSGASSPVTPAAAPKEEPAVTITNASPGHSPHSNKKWLIIALVAVGAGAGAAFAFKGKGSPSTPPTPGLSIGSPTISVGH